MWKRNLFYGPIFLTKILKMKLDIMLNKEI